MTLHINRFAQLSSDCHIYGQKYNRKYGLVAKCRITFVPKSWLHDSEMSDIVKVTYMRTECILKQKISALYWRNKGFETKEPEKIPKIPPVQLSIEEGFKRRREKEGGNSKSKEN